MTLDRPTSGFGERVRRIRKERGYVSAAAFADAIDNAEISEGVIKNIESGRKADISVAHLLEIAMALDTPPLALLFDMTRPDEPVDLPGLGAAWLELSNADAEYWTSWSMAFDPFAFYAGVTDRTWSSDESRLDVIRRASSLNRWDAYRQEFVDRGVDQNRRLDAGNDLERLRLAGWNAEQERRAIVERARELGIEFDSGGEN
jgi:transcriptional regulator with XRE-family HTH domain